MGVNWHQMGRWYWQWLVLLLVVVVAYGHTLDVPFYLDDHSSIRENSAVQGGVDPARIWAFSPPRFVSYLSFAINYSLHGDWLAGFHLVNISLHLAAGLALWSFARLLLRTPGLRERVPGEVAAWIPLLAALLYLLHPLQTQAVTYTVQRSAVLAAFFYLATMVFFLLARSSNGARRWGWFLCVALSALLAMLSKQNAATLPAALLLVEWLAFQSSRRAKLLQVLILAVGTGGLLSAYARLVTQAPLSVELLGSLLRETGDIGRIDYLMTQATVLWLYLGRLVWPAALHIDYQYSVWGGELVGYGALLGHLLVLVVGGYLWRRHPLAAFAILFYYLAHAVESSLLPIRDLVFEHRTYLPNAGPALLVGWVLSVGMARFRGGGWLLPLGVVLALGIGTWQRNQQWREPVELWRGNAELAPDKVRPWSILAKHLLVRGREEEASQAFERALKAEMGRADGDGERVPITVVINFTVSLTRQGRYDEAMKLIDHALNQPVNGLERSKLLVNRGNIHFRRKRYDEAESAYREAVSHAPHNQAAVVNFAMAMTAAGRGGEALEMLRAHLAAYPRASRVLEAERTIRAAIGR